MTPDPADARRRLLQAAVDACPPGYGWDNGVPVGAGLAPRAFGGGPPVAVVCDATGERWPSLSRAAAALGASAKMVGKRCESGAPLRGRVLRRAC